jgi:hypothetical protein
MLPTRLPPDMSLHSALVSGEREGRGKPFIIANGGRGKPSVAENRGGSQTPVERDAAGPTRSRGIVGCWGPA